MANDLNTKASAPAGGYVSIVAENGQNLDLLLSKIKEVKPATADVSGEGGLLPAPPEGEKKVYTSHGSWEKMPEVPDMTEMVSFFNFMTKVTTVTTLTGLPGDSHSIIANVSEATNFTMTAPKQGLEVVIRVNNTSASAITQSLPTTGIYQSMSGPSVSIPANSFIELSIWSIDGKLVIRVGEQA